MTEPRERWTLVVPDLDDADLLRRIGRKAIALPERERLFTELPFGPGSEVLCIGLAQRIAGDLHACGVETVWGIHVPLGHFSIRTYLEHVAEANGHTVINEELDQFLQILEDTAFDISDTKPTGHPDLPGADPNAPTRRILKARLRDRSKILDIAVTRWLIRSYATCGSVIFVVADPNLGKSTVANAWGHCIWTGHAWLGHAVLPGSVLFILGEDIRGASLRARAWEASYGPCSGTDGRYVEYADRMPPLCEESGQLELRRILLCLRAEHGHAPAMVVIDTLSTVWGAESENSAEMAAGLMAVLAALADEFGCTFLLVHHLNKLPASNQGKAREISLSSIRGASAFAGSADDVLVMEDTGNGTARLYGIKARNTDKAPEKLLRVHRVPLGVNEDGHEVSSVILVEAPPEEVPDAGDSEKAEQDAAWEAAEAMVGRAVEALRKLGSATSKTAIANRMVGKRSARLAGVGDAMTRGLIVNAGTAKHPLLVVAADRGGERNTPRTPQEGTGNRSPADAGPDPVPSDAGTGSPKAGTGNRSTVDADEGLPDQPKRRRKAQAGGA